MIDVERSIDRRSFVKNVSAVGAGVWATGSAPFFAARGAPNEKVVLSVVGLHSRGDAVSRIFAAHPNVEIAYACDVDRDVLNKAVQTIARVQGRAPRAVVDFRQSLQDPAVDAVFIATPDHWHTTAAVMAMQAGKHVYVEKPSSHDAREGEILAEAARKYGRVAQMGTQQRSGPRTIEMIEAIRGGIIGRPYHARTWYANRRASIGKGKVVPVPERLDWELWQGPAPREAYRDNVVHYNWHWFWKWGTGEICNNGTHEIDIARWALGVDFPTRVSLLGGHYHHDDDWETPDTEDAVFEFEGGKSLSWHGRSSNGFPVEGRGRGTTIHGTGGTILVDRNGFTLYDLGGKKIRESLGDDASDPTNTRGGGDLLTERHVANFIDGIRKGTALAQPVEEGRKSVHLCHLGNIAYRAGRELRVDPKTGRIRGDRGALRYWGRDYARGWTLKA